MFDRMEFARRSGAGSQDAEHCKVRRALCYCDARDECERNVGRSSENRQCDTQVRPDFEAGRVRCAAARRLRSGQRKVAAGIISPRRQRRSIVLEADATGDREGVVKRCVSTRGARDAQRIALLLHGLQGWLTEVGVVHHRSVPRRAAPELPGHFRPEGYAPVRHLDGRDGRTANGAQVSRTIRRRCSDGAGNRSSASLEGRSRAQPLLARRRLDAADLR